MRPGVIADVCDPQLSPHERSAVGEELADDEEGRPIVCPAEYAKRDGGVRPRSVVERQCNLTSSSAPAIDRSSQRDQMLQSLLRAHGVWSRPVGGIGLGPPVDQDRERCADY